MELIRAFGVKRQKHNLHRTEDELAVRIHLPFLFASCHISVPLSQGRDLLHKAREVGFGSAKAYHFTIDQLGKAHSVIAAM